MSGPVVSIEDGKLQGCILQTYKNDDFIGFLGVPFAEPPVGELRFKAPKPVKPWNGVKDATKYGDPNYALMLNEIDLTKSPTPIGSEDSLSLNVFTKELPKKGEALKPVMVWVHGGAFTMGSAIEYKPDILLTADIVLVTIQYRLGALGFLNFEDSDVGVPGNAGMKDMVLALKWVQKNIKQFNGDAENVTVFGESAGAGAVHYLMISPMTKGLFHKVITQSGCVNSFWAQGTKNNGMDLAKTLGCTSEDPKECLKFLQALPVEKLLQGQSKLRDVLEDTTQKRFFSPTVEMTSDEEPFLAEDALKLLKSGNYHKLPLITGHTSEEGLMFQLFGFDASLSPVDTCVPWYYGLEKGSKEYQEVAQTILKFYYGDKEPARDDTYYSILSDLAFNVGITEQAQLTASTSKEPVYFYILSEDADVFLKHAEKLGMPVPETKLNRGVSHGADIPFLFKFMEMDVASDMHELMINRFVTMWTNFARTGNPNSEGKDDVLQGLNWKPLKAGSYTHLDIGKELSCNEDLPNIERIKFWQEMDKTYRKL